MISVLTITYKRHHLLEEAIESFLRQELPPQCEMVIINDNAEVDYKLDHFKNVRIINHKERFSSIGAKLEWGYKQCKYNYIYRLDDDDLLTPWALSSVMADINANPGHDIYRSNGMYFFSNNVFEKEDLPNTDIGKQAYKHESKYWENKIDLGWDAHVDTTFALYRANMAFSYDAIRLDKPYCIKHAPWYLDKSCIPEEWRYYLDNANGLSTWGQNKQKAPIKGLLC